MNTRELIDALERAPGIIIPLVEEMPPALIKRRPAPAHRPSDIGLRHGVCMVAGRPIRHSIRRAPR
jgi:hypothetical protein